MFGSKDGVCFDSGSGSAVGVEKADVISLERVSGGGVAYSDP
jgi:hypothetical protein